MKIIIDQRTLRSAVDKTALFTARGSAFQFDNTAQLWAKGATGLETITISANGKLEFRAADLGSSIHITVPLAAPVIGKMKGIDGEKDVPPHYGVATEVEGSVTIPVELFQKAVDSMKDGSRTTLEHDVKIRRLKMLIGSQLVAAIATANVEKREPIVLPADARSFFIEAEKLRAIVQKCAPFVATDELRSAMMGVCFEYDGTTLTAVATNGHMLAALTMPFLAGAEPFAFIVPIALLKKAVRVLDGVVTIRFTPTLIQFESEGVNERSSTVEITGALIDEKYPDWKKVIPGETPYSLTAPRQELLASLTRLAIFANSNTQQISMRMHGPRLGNVDDRSSNIPALTLHAQNYDAGNEALEFSHGTFAYTGAETSTLVIGFNARFLRDTLEAMESDEVCVQFAGAVRPAIFREETEMGMDSLYLVMPVRLNDGPRDDMASTPLATKEPEAEETEAEHALAEADDEEFQSQAAEEQRIIQSQKEMVASFQAKPEEATR